MHFISKKHMPLGLFLESIKAQGAGWEGATTQSFPVFLHQHAMVYLPHIVL